MPDSQARLLSILRRFEDLNPDISVAGQREINALARECPPEAFPEVAAAVERLIELYQQTPTARVGEAILKEYFAAIDNSARQLAESGEITAVPREEVPKSFSTAMVLYTTANYGALDHVKILNRAEIPEPLSNAADSFRRRIEVVDTVFGIGFEALWNLDARQFEEWMVNYLERHQGNLSPEVIRDLLRVLAPSKSLSPRMLQWLLAWCADAALLEYWPLVTRFSDRLLGRIALRGWARQAGKPRNVSLAHLKLIVQGERMDDERLLAWLTNTLQNFGEGVERFIQLDRTIAPDEEAWVNTALRSELRTLSSTYVPILMLSDHLLSQPDGAAKLAMAFLGIIGKGLNEWEEQINALAQKIIRRAFLFDLREGRTPVETIRKFTFGDQVAFTLICNELELVSQQFGSVAQREVVVRKLAIYYASYRRAPMLGMEVARRYRHLARILHEDFLRQHLTDQEYSEVQAADFLHELSSMASLAKRFLDHRRALEMTVEEMVASEMEFVAETRARRLKYIRKYLE